jgi:hypothetical protein
MIEDRVYTVPPNVGKQVVLDLLQDAVLSVWPQSVIESMGLPGSERIFVCQSKDVRDDWYTRGTTPENSPKMVHVIFAQKTIFDQSTNSNITYDQFTLVGESSNLVMIKLRSTFNTL